MPLQLSGCRDSTATLPVLDDNNRCGPYKKLVWRSRCGAADVAQQGVAAAVVASRCGAFTYWVRGSPKPCLPQACEITKEGQTNKSSRGRGPQTTNIHRNRGAQTMVS